MNRQLQVVNGVARSEWSGNGVPPMLPVEHDVDVFNEDVRKAGGMAAPRMVAKDRSVVFVDVTNRPNAQVGHAYDVDTDTFTPPPPPPDYGASVDARAFLQLFTQPERKAVRRAARTDEDVEDFLAMAEVPIPIRLKHPETVAGLALLVSKGLLTLARATAIQNTKG